MCAVCLRHCRELQTHSVAGFYVPHDRVGPDLSLLNQKINLGGCTYGPGCGCFDKQSPDTEVPNTREIVSIVAPPTNRHDSWRVDTRGVSPGEGGRSQEWIHGTPEGPARQISLGIVAGQVSCWRLLYSKDKPGARQETGRMAWAVSYLRDSTHMV